jgi:hypothetical protein
MNDEETFSEYSRYKVTELFNQLTTSTYCHKSEYFDYPHPFPRLTLSTLVAP